MTMPSHLEDDSLAIDHAAKSQAHAAIAVCAPMRHVPDGHSA